MLGSRVANQPDNLSEKGNLFLEFASRIRQKCLLDIVVQDVVQAARNNYFHYFHNRHVYRKIEFRWFPSLFMSKQRENMPKFC